MTPEPALCLRFSFADTLLTLSLASPGWDPRTCICRPLTGVDSRWVHSHLLGGLKLSLFSCSWPCSPFASSPAGPSQTESIREAREASRRRRGMREKRGFGQWPRVGAMLFVSSSRQDGVICLGFHASFFARLADTRAPHAGADAMRLVLSVRPFGPVRTWEVMGSAEVQGSITDFVSEDQSKRYH
ncbi:hypothetical protein J3F84DRAFT_367849 [Trichoderma pleuroticola]